MSCKQTDKVETASKGSKLSPVLDSTVDIVLLYFHQIIELVFDTSVKLSNVNLYSALSWSISKAFRTSDSEIVK